MPRPKTKEELLKVGQAQFDKLWELIDSLTDELRKATFSFEDRDRNIRDILVHLYEWDILLLNWIENNLKGKKKHFLPDEYTWKTYPALNVEFREKHQKTSYNEAKKLIKNSHKCVMSKIDEFSDKELYTKKFYNWTGTTSLGSYCVSTTSSHYDWAVKKIKKHIKSLNS